MLVECNRRGWACNPTTLQSHGRFLSWRELKAQDCPLLMKTRQELDVPFLGLPSTSFHEKCEHRSLPKPGQVIKALQVSEQMTEPDVRYL